MRGRVYGAPAGSLLGADAVFGSADRNRVGAGGELRTAVLLDQLSAAENGPTVLHDLRIPDAHANIDHAVVSGRTVWLVDTKVWRPGFYVTLGEQTWRTGGPSRMLERFGAGEKRTMPLATRRVTEYLEAVGLHANVGGAVVVVWPSSESAAAKPLRLWAYRPAGARAVVGARALSALRQARRPADPFVVAALTPLLIGGR